MAADDEPHTGKDIADASSPTFDTASDSTNTSGPPHARIGDEHVGNPEESAKLEDTPQIDEEHEEDEKRKSRQDGEELTEDNIISPVQSVSKNVAEQPAHPANAESSAIDRDGSKSIAPELEETLSSHVDLPQLQHQTHSLPTFTTIDVDQVSHRAVSPASQPQTPTGPVSPITTDEAHMSVDSMTSIALSATSLDYDNITAEHIHDVLATPRVTGARHMRRVSSLDILQNKWNLPDGNDTLFDSNGESSLRGPASAVEAVSQEWPTAHAANGAGSSPHDSYVPGTPKRISSLHERPDTPKSVNTSSSSPKHASDGSSSGESAQVDWQALDKTEEQEKEDRDLPEGVEDESTAFLLARLEQENAKFNVDPKSAVNKARARTRAGSRPPSMAHIKKLVTNRDSSSLQYSTPADVKLPEEPPPMTELEFWAALVQDYPSTAARLPTLTTTKIRSGIPPPLRGVVWTSMAGARDADLEDAFEKLQGEKSPYEGIINKDVGRSFPGVELFRDADGEGQKMLGRVLKCFSLQDKDIGYCQGLGFLVGPLLMNMGECEAFCVLVRLMDHYSLRPSFLPSLSGLHMRIYQFSRLLKQHHSKLHEHLLELGVEPAYLSQWFLSCFAVTCPLPMLFRIYDVIFAEGANETVMRVALALMRRHEEQMLATSEFEEIMQLLLGRDIWHCYGGDADELVDDFTSLGDIVTHARLVELEKEFDNQSSETVGQSAGFLPDVQAAASRFLGRLWAPGHGSTPSKNTMHAPKVSVTNYSPQSAEKDSYSTVSSVFGRPSFLRRTPSKQDINTNDNSSSEDSNSNTGSGPASLASSAPTELDTTVIDPATGMIRESMADSMSVRSKAESMMPTTPTSRQMEHRGLHGQIEDLLTALSEMQREHAQMAAMLQREREDRSEDHRVLQHVLSRFRKDTQDERRRTMPPPRKLTVNNPVSKSRPLSVGAGQDLEQSQAKPKDETEELVEKIQNRLQKNIRFSASLETKAQLRQMLARAREQLAGAELQSKDLTSRLDSADTALVAFQSESDDLRSEVRELRARVSDEFKTRQKLEHQLREFRAQARSIERKERLAKVESMHEKLNTSKSDASPDTPSRKSSIAGSPAASTGLRELQLVRRQSSSSIQSIRSIRNPPLIYTEPTITPPSADSSSPFDAPMPSPDIITTPISAGPSGLSLPDTGFTRRTSSLATQQVLATPEHELVPDEALLLELVNAKTSEAQARQEIDELKKALSISKRTQEQNAHLVRAELKAELDAAKFEATKAREYVQSMRAELEAANKLNASASGPPTPSFSVPPPTLHLDEADPGVGEIPSPGDGASPGISIAKKIDVPTPPAATAAAAAGSGWFWSRRTPSKSNIPPL